MSDTTNNPDPHGFPEAQARRRRFQAVWLLPIVVGLIVSYLAVRSYASHGPTITIHFTTADGLSVGQTMLRYKFVVLGTVDSVTLNRDRKTVDVRVRMAADTKNLLTDHARFWVEKPHLGTTDIASIVAGTYIALDPGAEDGDYQDDFTGLDNPPDLPAEEAGTSYVLKADRLGAIAVTSSVFFRDMNVGEVLGTDLGDGDGPITVKIFVRAPYDKFVKPQSRFWNASGLSAKFGPEGLRVEVQSLQSVLGGGVAFFTPPAAIANAQADKGSSFTLYADQQLAGRALTKLRIPCVAYFEGDVKNLAAGSAVEIFGIRVGEVTGVRLSFEPPPAPPRLRVSFDFEPELAFGAEASDPGADAARLMQKLVESGMRAAMKSTDVILGQEIVALEFAPGKNPASVAREGEAILLPAQTGGGNLSDALGDVAAKLDQIPFDRIGGHLDHLLASADESLGSPEMRQAVHALAATLANAQDLSAKADKNLTPALRRLPEISAQLQNAAAQANQFMGSVNAGYGGNSDFQRNLGRTLNEVNDAARSIRLLADFLERHPEALIEGKTTAKGRP